MKISKTKRLQVVGLLTLAGQSMRQLSEIEQALCELLACEPASPDADFIRDAIYDETRRDVDSLLNKLGLKVQK